MNLPSKQQFFEHMSETFGYEFGCERSYELLKDVIREAKEESRKSQGICRAERPE